MQLACESYFGKEMLKMCTVYGHGNHPALPNEKVLDLKKKILSLHPQLISSPIEFETTWSKCVNAINKCASSLQLKEPPRPLGDLSNTS